MTPDGPRHAPLDISFQPPEGESQPFVHIMYDQDEVSIDV